jgi:rhodanese-related sulfurtransferase
VSRIDELLARARERLDRLEPEEAYAAAQQGAELVDIRSESQRARDGLIPGATYHPRNVLEWRYDAETDGDRLIVVVCDEGYQSSLAAATLRDLGLDATDLTGGFQAWRAAGLPVESDS